MASWLTPAKVAEYLGDTALADDPNLATACAGVEGYLTAFRSDVFGPIVSPTAGPTELDAAEVPADLMLGAVMWAAHVFQLRSAPSGFPGYGDGAGDAMFDLSFASNRSDIWRLTGLKRPVVS